MSCLPQHSAGAYHHQLWTQCLSRLPGRLVPVRRPQERRVPNLSAEVGGVPTGEQDTQVRFHNLRCLLKKKRKKEKKKRAGQSPPKTNKQKTRTKKQTKTKTSQTHKNKNKINNKPQKATTNKITTKHVCLFLVLIFLLSACSCTS